MQKIKSLIIFLGLCLSITTASATWSVIIIDPVTKQIGIAGASCTYSVYGIGAIVPGKGAVIVQAMSNPLPRMKGIRMIMADASPKEILEAMKDPEFDPEEQQYAVICVSDVSHPQTYTGKETNASKGALTSNGISVQGNTLVSAEDLKAVLQAAQKAQKESLPLADVLMLALEAGNVADKRCGDTRASSAFLTVMKPGDDPKNPYLNLRVNGDVNDRNAVQALRMKFNSWKAKSN